MIHRLFVVVNMKVIVTMTTVCLCHLNLFCKEFAGAVFTKSGQLQGPVEAVFGRAIFMSRPSRRCYPDRKISKLMEDEVGRLRCIIAQSTQKRRRQVENV
jgi:hypothetical protein